MWSFFKKEFDNLLTITLSGTYEMSTTEVFKGFVLSLLSSCFKSNNLSADGSSLKNIPEALNKKYLNSSEATTLFLRAFIEADLEFYLASKEYFSSSNLPEIMSLNRQRKNDKSWFHLTLNSDKLDIVLLNRFAESCSSSALSFMTLEHAEYSLQAVTAWMKAYYPSEENDFIGGNDLVKSHSPIIVLPSVGQVPWTASRFWFGEIFFESIPKEKILSFTDAQKTIVLKNGAVCVTMHENDIVDDETSNVQVRAAFKRHLGIEWPK